MSTKRCTFDGFTRALNVGHVECFAELGRANPADVEYSWYRDGQLLVLGPQAKRRKRDIKIPHFIAEVSPR